MKFLITASVFALLSTNQFAIAASGCATVTEVKPVNKAPMVDIYQLDKRGVSTGGQILQILSSFTPIGALASVAADVTVGVAGSVIRKSSIDNDRQQEVTSNEWKGVFEVTYQPDFGNPITIVIRDSEIKRYSIETGSRVVMFDPKYDSLITTDDGHKSRRSRPSIEVPRTGLLSLIYNVEIPDGENFSDKYIKVCFAEQDSRSFYTMSGPKRFATAKILNEPKTIDLPASVEPISEQVVVAKPVTVEESIP